MQNDPEKLVDNYNEFSGVRPSITLQRGVFRLTETEEQPATLSQEIIQTGCKLVNDKIDAILGPNNKLTRGDLALPSVRFVKSSAEHPTWAGYFDSRTNEIGIITGKVADRPECQTKIFIHEYTHFLSHNGRDQNERLDANTPIGRNNNVGFRRSFGLDIRLGKEGEVTSDYFLAFNEAVTEQFAIDVMPGVFETYGNYRSLLNQVIDDAAARKLGSPNGSGAFRPWSRDEIKDYIYRCFFKGDLDGFTGLLKNIYKKYDITEQEFGLMTHRDDLPSVIEKSMNDDPSGPPSAPASVAARVRERINNKTPDDYVTDVITPEPPNGGSEAELQYGTEYDDYIKEQGITYSHSETIEGRQYDVDSFGYIIFRGEEATSLFDIIRSELDDLLEQNIDAYRISERMDALLFQTYNMSMLSEGFRDFYIYKHSKIS